MQSRWTELGKEKLASSGLTTAIAQKLGMYEVPSARVVETQFEALPALIIPYFDIDGKPAKAHPSWPKFYRLRYLAKGNSIKDLATDKSQRYEQPGGTGVCAYFPKNMDWPDVVSDKDAPIIITEGELKAAAACEVGFPTIGLGGVWNFRTATEGYFFLPELEKINWVGRKVHICFDSDYATNPNVCAAINKLGEELLERGALSHALVLPDLLENGKTGLDDYFLERSPEEFETLLAESQPVTMARKLWDMNREIVYVRNPGLIVAMEDGLKLSPAAFKEHSHWSTYVTSEQKLTDEGKTTIKKIPAAPMWLKWPLRRSVRSITYAPGEAKITEENAYNQWPGWGIEPLPCKRDEVKPWLDLTKFLFKDMEPESLEYFYDWCAYPIQNPGSKLFTSCVVWGVEEGTGKSLLGYTLGRIYGKNFRELTDEDMESDYTAWAENKQFVMGDEVTGSDSRKYASRLKRLITQREITINIKHVPQYTVPDCINYFFTSNHADAFFMGDKDRRMFVVEVVGIPQLENFYLMYDKWLWSDGPRYLFQWLKDRKITKGFSPAARAPQTAAKQRMISAGKGELTSWIRDLLEHPGQVLVTGQMRHTKDLWSAKELTAFFKAQHPDSVKVTTVGLGRALSNAGVAQADDGRALRRPDGGMDRYYIVRNVDKWKRCKDRKKMEANLAAPLVKRNENR